MRTSTAAWTAALAVMSVQGPFTTAEAAPARNYAEGERPKYYFPKEVKRERAYSNTTETERSGAAKGSKTSTTSTLPETSQPSLADAISEVLGGGAAPATTPPSSTAWVPSFNPSAWFASMMGAGAVPEPTDSVVTSTITKTWQSPTPATQTYTVTWTETSSPSSSAAGLTTSSSIVAPSSYLPSNAVQPTSPSSSEVATTTSSTLSVEDTSALPSSQVAPVEPYGTVPSANSPAVVQPTTRTSATQQQMSAYSGPDAEEPTSRVRSRKHKQKSHHQSATEVVKPTSTETTSTRRHQRPSDGSASDNEPAIIVPPTPYTPKTTAAPSSEPLIDEEPTSELFSPSSYAIISSRSFSVPANTSSYWPTAPSSSSSSSASLAPSSSSSSDGGWLGGILPTSLGLPTSILQPSVPHSVKLSSSTVIDESSSRHHAGRPGRPSDATSAGLPETVVQPTIQSSTATDEITTTSAPSSGGLPVSIVLPTPHSSEGSTRTGHQGAYNRPDGEQTRYDADYTRQSEGNARPTGWPFDEPLLSGGLLPSQIEPSPTRRTSSTAADSASGSSTEVPIVASVPTNSETDNSQATRPSLGHPLASLGLTGLPTAPSALLPRPSDDGQGEGHNGPQGESSEESGRESTDRPTSNPFSNVGVTGVPTTPGQPTGIIPTALPLGTGANDSNSGKPDRTDRPDLGPIRPGQSSEGGEYGWTGLPSLPLSLPTTLPLESNGTDLGGVLPIPSMPETSATATTETESSETGAAGVLPISTPTSTLAHLSGAITSALSGVTSDLGTLLTTDTGSTPTLKTDTATTPPVLASIASSLSDELSSIVATATDPEVSPSLVSEYSSILSSAASSLASETSLTDAGPEETGSALPVVSDVTSNLPGTTIGTAAPSGAETSPPSYTLSISTGTDGTTAIPMPNTTPTSTTPTTEQVSSSADTASETYGSQTSPSDGSTVSTSIPLSTDTTIPTVTSNTSSTPTDVPSEYSTPSSSFDSESTAQSLTNVPSETTPLSSQNVTAPVVPETTPSTTPFTTPSTTPPETSNETSKETSIEPTGTNSATDYSLPTSWNFAPTSPPVTPESSGTLAVATSSTGTSAPGIPTYMPRLIQPPGGMPAPPSNATLIQLGLNYGLNFPFVVREQDSASQIFAYMPQGIAYGLGISHDKVRMNALMPYDTSKNLQYITTLAQAYVPSELVDQLELDLHTPMSSIYANPDDMIRTLMNMVNPTIPILPGASMDGDDSSSADNPAATGGPSSNQGAPIGGDTGESRPVRGSSVGIGVGAVCGAAAYAAAMVYIARRYKKKRASHQRASSVPAAGEMSENGRGAMGGFFMAGGRGSSAIGSDSTGSRYSGHSSNGRSVREQGISAPVMSENSLGWN